MHTAPAPTGLARKCKALPVARALRRVAAQQLQPPLMLCRPSLPFHPAALALLTALSVGHPPAQAPVLTSRGSHQQGAALSPHFFPAHCPVAARVNNWGQRAWPAHSFAAALSARAYMPSHWAVWAGFSVPAAQAHMPSPWAVMGRVSVHAASAGLSPAHPPAPMRATAVCLPPPACALCSPHPALAVFKAALGLRFVTLSTWTGLAVSILMCLGHPLVRMGRGFSGCWGLQASEGVCLSCSLHFCFSLKLDQNAVKPKVFQICFQVSPSCPSPSLLMEWHNLKIPPSPCLPPPRCSQRCETGTCVSMSFICPHVCCLHMRKCGHTNPPTYALSKAKPRCSLHCCVP